MHKPPQLFKYGSLNELNIQNLRDQVLYFQNPGKFNDPYDCALFFDLKAATAEEIEHHRALRLANPDLSLDERNYLLHSPDKVISEEWGTAFNLAHDDIREKWSLGVCCFSQTKSNLLMWGHYGEKYAGMCLEFSTEAPLFESAISVQYSEKIPILNRFAQMNTVDLLRTKPASWSYEQEWRVLSDEPGAIRYFPGDLRAVYFGPRSLESSCQAACRALSEIGSSVRIFKGRVSTAAFKVEFMPYQPSSEG